jgi:hypothetical protein
LLLAVLCAVWGVLGVRPAFWRNHQLLPVACSDPDKWANNQLINQSINQSID